MRHPGRCHDVRAIPEDEDALAVEVGAVDGARVPGQAQVALEQRLVDLESRQFGDLANEVPRRPEDRAALGLP